MTLHFVPVLIWITLYYYPETSNLLNGERITYYNVPVILEINANIQINCLIGIENGLMVFAEGIIECGVY